MKPQVVIVGGGFGGLTAARRMGSLDADVILIDRSNHHLFQPLLYQIATAGLAPSDIATPIRSILRNQKNTEVLMSEVVGVDRVRKKVRLNDGLDVAFDYLILATGSHHHYFGHPEWGKFAPGLKSIVDATMIRRNILTAFEQAELERDLTRKSAHITFVLVGGGPTGVELAGAIAELSKQALSGDFRHIDPGAARIVLIEAGPRILAGFSEESSKQAERELGRLGVEILCNMRVDSVDAEGVSFQGKKILSHTVIWTAGVLASKAGEWLNADLDRSGRVLVGKDLSVSGSPEIFVVGDSAAVMQDGKPLPGTAPVAMQEGRFVAALISDAIRGKKDKREFRYKDKGNLATVGRAFAVAELPGNLRFHGLIAWMIWVVVHIYYLIGFRNRALVLTEWFWAYVTFKRGARLITEGRNSQLI